MADEISIWRWVVDADLEALFARLIAADDAGFNAIAQEMSMAAPPASTDQVFADAEAKVRAMGLPEEDLATTLAGLRAMHEEALAEEAMEGPEPDGRIAVALASSQMFFDDPYASLPHAEIERQVVAAMEGYRAAIRQAVGGAGQSLAAYLGLDPARLSADAVGDVLMESGLADVEWLWQVGDQMVFLSHWHEDKELPIDLEFGRAPLAIFDAARERIAGSHEM